MDNSLTLFFKDLSQYPILSSSEEKELLIKTKNGDKEARDKLVNSNVRLVVPIAKTYQGAGIPFEDLISYGIMGLIHAIDKFDLNQNTRLSTYSVQWIRQYIARALNNYSKTIRVPVYIMEIVNRLRKVDRELTVELGRTPTDIELANKLDITPDKVKKYKKYFNDTESLDTPIDDDSGNTIGSLVEDTYFINPLDNCIKQSQSEDICSIVDTLSPREAEIIKSHYGLGKTPQKSIDEIAISCGLTKERIRQIENKALRKLRAPSRAKKLKEFIF